MRMAGVSVSRVTCTPCEVGRSPRAIKAAPSPDLLVNIVAAGAGAVRTPGRRRLLREGEAVLCEADSAYHLELAAPVTVLTLQLDRHLLPIRASRIREAHAVPLYDAGRVSVLHHFMTGLLAGGERGLNNDERHGVIARDLLLLALHEHGEITSVTEQASAYVVVRSLLERHFADPDLTVDRVARRLRVSRRYVENLFAREGHSPAAYLRALRVDHAQAMLAASATLTVTEAARLSGFNDAATFRRAFRRAKGLPPDAWRRRQRAASAASTDPSTGRARWQQEGGSGQASR
jgi:AraC-like DNA-binding protein